MNPSVCLLPLSAGIAMLLSGCGLMEPASRQPMPGYGQAQPFPRAPQQAPLPGYWYGPPQYPAPAPMQQPQPWPAQPAPGISGSYAVPQAGYAPQPTMPPPANLPPAPYAGPARQPPVPPPAASPPPQSQPPPAQGNAERGPTWWPGYYQHPLYQSESELTR